jgi:hypothetical protein
MYSSELNATYIIFMEIENIISVVVVFSLIAVKVWLSEVKYPPV